MTMSTRASLAITATAIMIATGVLAGCSSAAKEAAEAAFNECHNPTAEPQVLRLDGKNVILEVTGDAARAYAGADHEIEKLADGTEGMEGIVVLMHIVLTAQCLTEATNYPGSYDQLRDGEEWDGWSYTEEPGAGSAITFTFASTA